MADLHTLVVPRNAAPGSYQVVATYEGADAPIGEVRVEVLATR